MRSAVGGKFVPSVMAVTAAVIGAGTAPALAAGGNSIAAAVMVAPGTSYSGNTTSDATEPAPRGPSPVCNGTPAEWFSLHLVQGDEVLITVKSASPGNDMTFGAYPPGTTDEDVDSTAPVEAETVGTTVTASTEGTFTAGQSGNYPFMVGSGCGGAGGPFTVTAEVKHEALLYTYKAVRTATSRATVDVYVRYPGGASVSGPGLMVYLYGRWRDFPPVPPTNHLLAQAHPVEGTAVLNFRLPADLAGERVPLIATAAGADYETVQQVGFTDIVKGVA